MVDRCLKGSCHYRINAWVIIAESKCLDLDIQYVGEVGLNQKVIIWGFDLKFGD